MRFLVGEKIHALLCSRPESLEEIPPTSFEMLGVLRSLTSITGPTSQGAMVVMRVDTWKHLNASSWLRAACPACLHQGGCLSKGQSTNKHLCLYGQQQKSCRTFLCTGSAVCHGFFSQPQCHKSLWGASVCAEHVLAHVVLGWSYDSTHARQHATAELHPRSDSDFPCLYSLTIQGNNLHGFLIVLRV